MSEFGVFHFIRPLWLLMLIPLAVWVWRSWHRQKRAGLWESICDPELLPFVLERTTSSNRNTHGLLFGLLAAILIIALAGPTWQRIPTPVFREQSALVIVLDLSRSMNATDIKPSRLARAKFKISDILRLRKDGQTALLVFADEPFVVTPLTNDVKTIENQLPALTTDIMPGQGSNVDRALAKAAELLRQAGITDGDILLLADGVADNVTDTVKEISANLTVRISVIGVGTETGAPVPNDRGGFISDESGNVVLMTLDTQALRELADGTGGLYQNISLNDGDAERLSRFLERRQRRQSESTSDLFADRWREFGPWLLLLALPFAPLVFRRGILTVTLAAGLSIHVETAQAQWFFTQDQLGQRAFEAEQFDTASEQFEHPAWRAAAAYRDGNFETAVETLAEPTSADDWYNKGNALARQGLYEDALTAYDNTLETHAEHADAAYNKALLEKLLEQQQQQNEGGGDGEQEQSENDGDQGDQSSGQNEQPSDSEQSGGDSTSNSEQMNNEQQSDEANQNAEREQQEQTEESAEQQSTEQQESEGAEQQLAEAEPIADAESEENQATEQWLRQIPDDPGGLLRRKFEYEYQKRGGGSAGRGNTW